MRVHKLDEKYGISREAVREALEFAGLPTHHNSTLNDEELGQFEGALEILAEGGNVQEEVSSADSSDPEEVETSDEAPEPEPEPNTQLPEADLELEKAPELQTEALESDEVLVAGVEVNEGQDTPEEMGERLSFPVCNVDGSSSGWCELDIERGEKVAAVLGDRKICSHILDLDRGEFRAITWPDMQSVRVPL